MESSNSVTLWWKLRTTQLCDNNFHFLSWWNHAITNCYRMVSHAITNFHFFSSIFWTLHFWILQLNTSPKVPLSICFVLVTCWLLYNSLIQLTTTFKRPIHDIGALWSRLSDWCWLSPVDHSTPLRSVPLVSWVEPASVLQSPPRAPMAVIAFLCCAQSCHNCSITFLDCVQSCDTGHDKVFKKLS